MDYKAIKVRYQDTICFVQLCNTDNNNAINDCLIKELHHVLDICMETVTIVVLEGMPEVFCMGADFQEINAKRLSGEENTSNPEPLYDLWTKLAAGPYIVISHVRGKVNAGGIGFIAASDIVLADNTAEFSLSEMLFGLLPACVMPFLIRRIGFQKANYLTLMTQPIQVQQALAWGLVDASDDQSAALLRKHLLRLRHLSKAAISRHKVYMNKLSDSIYQSKALALEANIEAFSDPVNLEKIYRYVEKGKFPWEA